ncbi:hypothetical protein HY004_02200 [Candidatus Saccharibacteria bacterium]|nr:hypothetical protein [Candidatus Saccharibacteria bacterium]
MQGFTPKWVLTAFVVLTALTAIGFSLAANANKNKPDTKTELQNMGFVFVELENDRYAHVVVPGVTGTCRIDVFKDYDVWTLYKPTLNDEKPVITSAKQAKTLPVVKQWCGLPKQ